MFCFLSVKETQTIPRMHGALMFENTEILVDHDQCDDTPATCIFVYHSI